MNKKTNMKIIAWFIMPAMVIGMIPALLSLAEPGENEKNEVTWPVPFAEKTDISAGFPYYDDGTYHGGIDINKETKDGKYYEEIGANVVSVYDGEVEYVGWNPSGYGRYAEVIYTINNKEYSVIYAHMLHGSIRVNAGDTVSRGQILGSMGTTGNSTGTHLHYQVEDITAPKKTTQRERLKDPLTEFEYKERENPKPVVSNVQAPSGIISFSAYKWDGNDEEPAPSADLKVTCVILDGTSGKDVNVVKIVADQMAISEGGHELSYDPSVLTHGKNYYVRLEVESSFGYSVLSELIPIIGIDPNPTASSVLVNGVNQPFDAYNIGGSNYFKLRDLAYVLNGTQKQFEVDWDAENDAITLTSGKVYTQVGGEMTGKGGSDQTAVPTTSKIYLDGKEVQFDAYNIGGSNYFKLRDVGQALDFGVDWDGEINTIIINTEKGYLPDFAPPVPDTSLKVTNGKTVIEAEDFDGGEGNYKECSSPWRPVYEARPNEKVATEICENTRNDAPNPNYNIGWTMGGDWVQFTVNVETDGDYKIEAWLASANENPSETAIYIDGAASPIGYAKPSQTNGIGWQEWYLEEAGIINLATGKHVIKVVFLEGDINLDALVITRV